MTKEDKELLLKDLCARLPYEVNANISFNTEDDGLNSYPIVGIVGMKIVSETDVIPFSTGIESVKPYLRPMSSMTKEERKEWLLIDLEIHLDNGAQVLNGEEVDFLLSHHFDYRGLIEKGLAFEAPEGMYKTE